MSYSSEVLADSPVVYFRMNESSGTTMVDSRGSGRDGTYVGSPTLGVTGATNATDGDDAVTLNGSTQYASIASLTAGDDALKAMTGSFTVECWINYSSTSGTRGLLDRYGSGGSTVSVWLLYSLGGKPRFLVRNASTSGDVYVDAATTLTTGGWHHVVGVFDDAADEIRIYIDGAEDATPVAMTGTVGHNRSPILTIGALVFTSGYFPGSMDEVAVYPSALSDARIAAHYEAATTIPGADGTLAAVLPALTASLSGGYAAPPPAGTLGAVLPSLTASLSGGYQAPPVGTLDAVLPALTASLSGTYDAPPIPTGILDAILPSLAVEITGGYVPPTQTGVLDAVLPALTVALSGEYDGPSHDGILTALLPALTVDLTGTYGGPYPTDTSNDLGGIRLEGSGVATVTRPVAAPPASLVLAHRVDKAAAYPTPTMVNGRPT